MQKRTLSLALCLMIVLGLVLPLTARAQEPERKVVRVGWYESTYCYRDQYGQRRGIAYGMARREGDESVAPVFERADQNMYGNKSDLKSGKA